MTFEVWLETEEGPRFLVGALSAAQAETLVANLREAGLKATLGGKETLYFD